MTHNIIINAPKERVWQTLWNDETYRKWTSPFAEGSSAETDWQKGSKIIFGDGKGNGMVSRVEENIPNEYMSIKHLGIMKDGVEEFETADAKLWADAFENYTLKENNGTTEVKVELTDSSIPDDFIEYFEKTWPQALNKLKELAEER